MKLMGKITNGSEDKWSAQFYEEHVELWCESDVNHSIKLDRSSMVMLRDMLNDILWRYEDE